MLGLVERGLEEAGVGAYELTNQFLGLFPTMNMQLKPTPPRNTEVDTIIPIASGVHTETGFKSNPDLFDSRTSALFPTSSDHTL